MRRSVQLCGRGVRPAILQSVVPHCMGAGHLVGGAASLGASAAGAVETGAPMAPRVLLDDQPAAAARLLDATDTVLFDCDGVLWVGSSLVPGAPRALAALRAAGKRVLFVTNNSSKSRAQYVDKFRSLGIQADAAEVRRALSGSRGAGGGGWGLPPLRPPSPPSQRRLDPRPRHAPNSRAVAITRRHGRPSSPRAGHPRAARNPPCPPPPTQPSAPSSPDCELLLRRGRLPGQHRVWHQQVPAGQKGAPAGPRGRRARAGGSGRPLRHRRVARAPPDGLARRDARAAGGGALLPAARAGAAGGCAPLPPVGAGAPRTRRRRPLPLSSPQAHCSPSSPRPRPPCSLHPPSST